ncbi:MAG: ATP-binding protein [Planctomycetota bacterium]
MIVRTAWLHSLRLRLVMLNLLLFGAAQGLLSWLVLILCKSLLFAEFDQRLIDGAASLAGVIDLAAREAPEVLPGMRLWPGLGRFHFPEAFYQITRPDGQVLERSSNLGRLTLPLSDAADQARATGEPVLDTLADQQLEAAVGGGNPLRIVTTYHVPPAAPPCYLQVGLSEESVHGALAVLRRALWRLVPVGLLLSTIASWFWARRALGPIGRISREARRLTAATLPGALPVPRGEDELTEMVVTLNQMLSRLERAFRAQERFAANAAHELRTPVTHLLGQAQVMAARERSPDEYRSFLQHVQDEMRQLASTVESLLILAREDAGLGHSPLADVSVNEAVMDAVQQCEPMASAAMVRIAARLDEPAASEADLHVRGDAHLLQVLFSNLLRNAVRHSPPRASIEVVVSRRLPHAVVTVRDHGPGIAASLLPRLFERGAVPVRETSNHGTGLGLAIAHSVVCMHRGQISARNRDGGGAEFEVLLPVSADDAPPAA